MYRGYFDALPPAAPRGIVNESTTASKRRGIPTLPSMRIIACILSNRTHFHSESFFSPDSLELYGPEAISDHDYARNMLTQVIEYFSGDPQLPNDEGDCVEAIEEYWAENLRDHASRN